VKLVWFKVLGLGLVLILLTVGVQTMSMADEGEGVYLELSFPYDAVKGDFDGESFLTGGGEKLVLPRIESEFGYGIALGGKISRNMAIELNYISSTHDSNWSGYYYRTGFRMIGADLKLFLSDSRRNSAKPYLILGAGIPTLVVKDGAFNGYIYGDATFTGYAYNLGGGIELRLDRNLAVIGEMIYRRIYFDHAEGIHSSGDIVDKLNGGALNYKIGITYYLD
jgi:hypothetical protein